jgi:hypothetical protein
MMVAALCQKLTDCNAGIGDVKAGDKVFGLAYGSAVSRQCRSHRAGTGRINEGHG